MRANRESGSVYEVYDVFVFVSDSHSRSCLSYWLHQTLDSSQTTGGCS